MTTAAPIRIRASRGVGLGERGGFALPLALVVMVVVSMLVTAGLWMARNDLLASAGIRQSIRALYAAEAGSARTFLEFGSLAVGGLSPGDSLSLGWRNLPDGAAYRTVLHRADDGSGVTPPLYQVVTVGRPRPGSSTERVVVTLIQGGGGGGSLCCDGAMVFQGRLRVRGQGGNHPPPEVDGTDRVPPGWNRECDAPGGPLPGVRVGPGSSVRYQQGGNLEGDPPELLDRDMGAQTFENFGWTTYDALAAQADYTFTRNETFRTGDIRPVVIMGACFSGVSTNWGEPRATGHPCWDHRPIIHFTRNLTLRGDDRGQGILLVDGNLTINGSFEFYGIVIVKGRLRILTDGAIVGGVFVQGGNQGNQTSQIQNGGSIQYSSCAVDRVDRSEGGAGISRLSGRSWFEFLY